MLLSSLIRPRGACVALVCAALLSSESGASAPSPQEPTQGADRARGARRVRISVIPAGAKLWIDGVETGWFARTHVLAVGSHRVQAEVPGSRCCRSWSGVVRVAAATRPEEPQRIVIRLDLAPAKLVLVDAPLDAELSCSDLGVVAGLGELRTVHLREPEWFGSCEFRRGRGHPARARVHLLAGEVNTIAWPSAE